MKIDPPARGEHAPDFGEERLGAVAGLEAVADDQPVDRGRLDRPAGLLDEDAAVGLAGGPGHDPLRPGHQRDDAGGVGEERPEHRRGKAVADDRHAAGVRPELAQSPPAAPAGPSGRAGCGSRRRAGRARPDALRYPSPIGKTDAKAGPGLGGECHAARDRHRPLSERQLCLSPARRGDGHGGAGRRAGGRADRGGAERAGLAARPHPDHPPPRRPCPGRGRAAFGRRRSWVPPRTGRGSRPSISPSSRAARWRWARAWRRCYDVPGHTVGHIAYYFPEAGALFSADSLMVMGCGRLFEGTAEQMWQSLSRLAALPDDTAVYSGHEYAASNVRFALSVDADNVALKARAGGNRGDARAERADGAGAAGPGAARRTRSCAAPIRPSRPGSAWRICRMPKFSPRCGAARMLSEQAQHKPDRRASDHCIFFALSAKGWHNPPLKRDG